MSTSDRYLCSIAVCGAFALTLLAGAQFAFGDEPNETARLSMHAISGDNAHRVRLLKEIPLRVDGMTRGPRANEFIVWSYGGAAAIVDDDRFETRKTLAKDGKPSDVAVSRDGKLAAWGDANGSAYTIERLDEGTSHKIEIGDNAGFADFSADGKRIAVGRTYWDPAAHGAGHSETLLLDLEGKVLQTLDKTGPGAVHPLFSPDGRILAVGNRNRETLLFDADRGVLLHTLDKPMIQEIAFSPNGEKLSAGYVDGEVGLWDVATGEKLQMMPSGCQEVYSVAWSPAGDLLATSGRGGPIVLWDPRTMKRLKTIEAPLWVIQVRFTRDGARLLAASAADGTATTDRKVSVWSVDGADQR